ncbi:hypothetical protein [Paraburkholderia sp. BL6669N2]|uniref:hypothetical protein n=1 Tax=Paraburkholderia sp. BL6669N2 TaxID=1938807 RepID=UPI0015F256F8|nr:hypothetical protein [Paraburkholderia sp. BL6669N2]
MSLAQPRCHVRKQLAQSPLVHAQPPGKNRECYVRRVGKYHRQQFLEFSRALRGSSIAGEVRNVPAQPSTSCYGHKLSRRTILVGLVTAIGPSLAGQRWMCAQELLFGGIRNLRFGASRLTQYIDHLRDSFRSF